MADNVKWKPGAVKLVDGSNATIHYVQEACSTVRYIGMYHRNIGAGYAWWPIAWTVTGSVFPFDTKVDLNLVPPKPLVTYTSDEKLSRATELLARVELVLCHDSSVTNSGQLHKDICKFLEEWDKG
jgi:hypothetical protein